MESYWCERKNPIPDRRLKGEDFIRLWYRAGQLQVIREEVGRGIRIRKAEKTRKSTNLLSMTCRPAGVQPYP